ncbi:hypothetical protein SLH46_02200 [Draconibacterium sp. IB214405]|uniref:hypothetical protein n=1 Tax=Draconibacterium sp. IB214405 TaxID=3097352 RepID=UPI002A14D595|nr:hypothetical protein [Draconibacterium sp. IB214405]MDX8337976.1 hypothetical protein [Draconibacterium sp. IB214405]
MIQRVFFFIFLLTTLNSSGSTLNNDSIANRVFTLIYEQNLTEAEKIYTSGKDELNEFYRTFLNLDLHWWKYRTTYSKENSDKLDQLIDASILPETDTYEKKMRQIIVRSYQLRYDKKKFNIFGMLSARSDIRDLIADIEKEAPPFTGDEQKLFESYVIMYQYIENINFFANAKKSEAREKKLKRMEKFAEEDNVILNTVADFFLARMYQKIEDKPEVGLEHFKILTRKYPTNKTFAEYQAECEENI